MGKPCIIQIAREVVVYRAFFVSLYLSYLFNMEQIIMNIFPKRQEGQGLVEYALILVLVAVAVIVILQLLGPALVLTYARVMGGFDGQTISGVGREAIAVSYGLEETPVGDGDCQGTLTDILFVLTEDGRLVTNETVTATINGSSVEVTIPGNGLANHSGPIAVSGRCPIKPNISW
jgi:pilus assembly protein Flp/PilA